MMMTRSMGVDRFEDDFLLLTAGRTISRAHQEISKAGSGC